MESVDTKTANPIFLGHLSDELEKLFNAGKTAFETGAVSEVKDIDGMGTHILNTDEEKYSAIQLLETIFNFKGVAINEVYKIRGVKMQVDGREVSFPICLPMSKLEALADKASFLESKLSDMGLKFPAQLFQFQSKYKGQNLPGRDFPPPKPQPLEMSDEDYEKYLEQHYKSHGVEKVSDGAAFRQPYPNEKINYREANEEKEGYTNEYFQETLAVHAKGKGETTKAETGKKIKVVATSVKKPTLKEKDKVRNSINWEKVGSFVIKAAAIAGGVYLAGTIFGVNPLGVGMLAVAGASYAVARYIKKRREIAKAKEKLAAEEAEKAREAAEKEAEKAKEKEKEKDKGKAGEGPVVEPPKVDPPKTDPTKRAPGGDTGGTPSGSDPTPPVGPTGKDDDSKPVYNHEDMLLAEEEIGLDATEFARIDSELAIVYNEIQALMGSSDPKDADRLRDLQANLQAKLNERLELTRRLMDRQERLMEDIGISRRSR